MKAYVFPGQGSQFKGMGKDLYERSEIARKMFAEADNELGFNLSQVMFAGGAAGAKGVILPATFALRIPGSPHRSRDRRIGSGNVCAWKVHLWKWIAT